MLKFFRDRILEPSTWAGIGLVLSGLVDAATGGALTVANGVAALGGILAVVIRGK